jgi:hypothetical protein
MYGRSISWLKAWKQSVYQTAGTDVSTKYADTGCTENESNPQIAAKITSAASQVINRLTQIESRIQQCKNRDFLLAYYHCGHISISRLFVDPAWLPYNPPSMSETFIKQHSLTALDHVEKVNKKAQLEAVFMLPVLLVVSLETREQDVRTRIAVVLKSVQSRGFVVASTYFGDISMLWDVFKSHDGKTKDAVLITPQQIP